MQNKGRNPIQDLRLLLRLLRLFRRERLSCVLTFTVKPNIYGSVAAHLLGIPSIANVAGLGSGYAQGSLTQRLVALMYRGALAHPAKIFFQNGEDLSLLTSSKVVRAERAERLPGSGVDVSYYSPQARKGSSDQFVFLLSARLLREKGIEEYVAAARVLSRRHTNIEFRMLGFADVESPSAITLAQIKAWDGEGAIKYLGETKDVRPFIADADCVVLPSYYREGVPRSLLEAASMGKPIITTDMPGCRDAIEDRATGFLVKPRNVGDLVEKMEAIVGMPRHLRDQMGDGARARALAKFDERLVTARYLAEVQRALIPTASVGESRV